MNYHTFEFNLRWFKKIEFNMKSIQLFEFDIMAFVNHT